MDLLKRELAPVLPGAWEEIETEARRVLGLNLGGRKLVDLDGPHGWELAAANTGRLELIDEELVEGVHLARRRVQRLAEVRIPIRLDQMELDQVARGSADPDLEPVVEAAEKVAQLENLAIFQGAAPLGITGVIEASPHPALDCPDEAVGYPHVVVEASETLRRAGIDGPYGLALGPQAYNDLAQAAEDGYPIRKRLDEIIDGPVVWVPALEGAVLLSMRGGDYVLTVGQDLSVGYCSHDRDTVELYLTESFTFRVLEPAAAVFVRHS